MQQIIETKSCGWCFAALHQNSGESDAAFAKRSTCNREHAAKLREEKKRSTKK